ncbi:TetR/AcrR family transcriptional regulator [Nocardia sp. NPDC052566]|uniref:TetR/AcrR family transcriptional regulator n=1 Tax=Nocardia sp. NPDC052566 TaxID=3364330 RepID=UPI0037CBDEF3
MNATGRRRGPRADARHNDEHILSVGARVLAEDPNATIQRIADEAGLTRMTIYRRYRNRDALRAAIYDAAAREARDIVDRARERDADPITALRDLITAMAALSHRYPVLSTNTDWQPLPTDRHRPSSSPAARRMQQVVFELVERGRREGFLRTDLPPELLPHAIVGTLQIVGRFARSMRADPAMIGPYVAELLLNGYATRP